jgi:hypothetical protein
MLRTHSLIAASVVLLLLAACSTTTEDAPGPGCANLTKDDGEEGVDCGGICPTKCTGSGCTSGDQCSSGKCENGVCGAPAGKTCGVGVATKCNDGDKCELDKDCTSNFCDGATCAQPAAGSHSDGQKNGGETGIDCGGSVKATQPCPDGQGCTDSADCVGTCNNLVCGPIGPTDGKKNQGETDIDCGGPTAPKCATNKACLADTDCLDDYCPDGTKKCTVPSYTDGVQNGTETDTDCGGAGAGMKKCAQGKTCKVDGDCNGACNYATKCVDMPSCKRQHGGDTCGGGDLGNGDAATHTTGADPMAPGHEDCCRTLPVSGYVDPNQPGKTVYLDKYEITSGRIRAFLEAIGGGSDPVLPAGSTNAKPANVKAYMAAHRPARWNPGWENVLPGNNQGSQATYVVKYPTDDLHYPGQDVYASTSPQTWTQNTWWIRATGPADPARQVSGQQGTYTIETGVFYELASGQGFPEFYANPAVWPPPNEGEGYAEAHALNCFNGHGAYGWSTYWLDDATISQYSGGVGKAYAENLLDEKSMNCSPFALYAAFCAWDGGQLATAEVMDAITGNTVEPVYTPYGTVQGGKLLPGNSFCGTTPNTLNTFSDGTQGCYNVYYYPSVNDALPLAQRDFDDTGKIASPGRVVTDVITNAAGDEPWMDLIGNLAEAVLKRGETNRFDYRGYGVEYGSIQHHKTQQSTPRGKGGAFGARCMRFK